MYINFNMEKEMIDKLEQQWIQKISKLLVGKKIIKVEI